MFIKFWGARGSISVCGKEFIRYGGNTTCVEVKDKNNELIVIDCGTGVKNLGKILVKSKIRKINILFTHWHIDHVIGFPFFAPIYNERNEIIIRGYPYHNFKIDSIISNMMRPPSFPVKFDEIDAKFTFIPLSKEVFKIGNIEIKTIELNHPDGGAGYKLIEDGRVFVFLTDNEIGYKHPGGRSFYEYVEFLKGADIAVLDAEYTDEEYKTKRGWGHSTYSQAAELAISSGVKNLYLFHHNQERTDDEIDENLKKVRKILKDNKSKIKCFAAYEREEINL